MATEIIDDPLYEKPCCHPEHNPPSHIFIPEGKMLKHTCPACGKETIVRKPLPVSWARLRAPNAMLHRRWRDE